MTESPTTTSSIWYFLCEMCLLACSEVESWWLAYLPELLLESRVESSTKRGLYSGASSEAEDTHRGHHHCCCHRRRRFLRKAATSILSVLCTTILCTANSSTST